MVLTVVTVGHDGNGTGNGNAVTDVVSRVGSMVWKMVVALCSIVFGDDGCYFLQAAISCKLLDDYVVGGEGGRQRNCRS